MLTRMSIAAVLFMLSASYTVAEEQLGVTVYPGATYDQVLTKLLKKSPSVEGAVYWTGDTLAEVADFYRKQGLIFLRLSEPMKERARFKKTDTGVDVVLQNPWKDPRTGATMKGTLIMIIRGQE